MMNYTQSDRGRGDNKRESKVEKGSFTKTKQLCKAVTLIFRFAGPKAADNIILKGL